jgi:hypothetical protein
MGREGRGSGLRSEVMWACFFAVGSAFHAVPGHSPFQRAARHLLLVRMTLRHTKHKQQTNKTNNKAQSIAARLTTPQRPFRRCRYARP